MLCTDFFFRRFRIEKVDAMEKVVNERKKMCGKKANDTLCILNENREYRLVQ